MGTGSQDAAHDWLIGPLAWAQAPMSWYCHPCSQPHPFKQAALGVEREAQPAYRPTQPAARPGNISVFRAQPNLLVLACSVHFLLEAEPLGLQTSC